ncbi:MAG: roadblock/LC7 domain-containing protein [Candidatus Heimdallarchaeota archaeon]
MIVLDISTGLHAILIQLLKSSNGLQQIMLTDATGLVIGQVSRQQDSETPYNLEGIGSLACALYSGMQEQGDTFLKIGDLESMISEFADGKLIMQGVTPEYVMIGITKPRANVKKIRESFHQIRSDLLRLIQLLKKAEEIEITTLPPLIDEEKEKDPIRNAISELDF